MSTTIENIDLGTAPNDKTGTPLRDGGSIINENTSKLLNLSNKIEQGKVLIFKDTNNSSIASIEQNDVIIGLIEEGSVKYLIKSKYNTGSVSDYGTAAGLFNDGSYDNLGYDVVSGTLQTYLPLLQGYLPLTGGVITGNLTVSNSIIANNGTFDGDLSADNIEISGDVTANNFIGDGSGITNLPQQDLSSLVTLGTSQEITASKTFSGSLFLKNRPVSFFSITTGEIGQQTSVAKIGFNSFGYLQLLPDLELANGSLEIDFSNLTAKRTVNVSDFDGEIPIQTDKITPTLNGTWANVSGYTPISYWKVGKTVYFEGSVGGGSLSDYFFTFPVGYRPLNTKEFNVVYFNGLSVQSYWIDVDSSGQIGSISGGATASRISLTGFFRID